MSEVGEPTTSLPLVSVIIPVLNEEADIAGCIQAIGAQDYPIGRMELIVVDGCSEDQTVPAVRAAAAEWDLAAVKVLDNPRRRTSTSLNVGLAQAEGDVVVRVDARARLAPTHVRACVELLADERVGVAGGAQRTMARSPRLADRGIARALRNRLATGLSRYRRATRSGPADTVWMGSFRRADLVELGGWNDQVALNEDWDLNDRFRRRGQQVWFSTDLAAGYLPRTSYPRLARQYFAFGRVKGLWWVRGMRPQPRQLALVAIPVVGLAATGALVRRLGPAALAVVPAGFLAIEVLGADEPADVAERAAAAGAIAVFTTSWWVGLAAGAIGELAGVEHRHGTDV